MQSVRNTRSARRRWVRQSIGLAGVVGLMAGCSLDSLTKSDLLPPDVADPARAQTPAGAVAAYHGALAQFRDAVGGPVGFVATSGALTDELQDANTGGSLPLVGGGGFSADARTLPEGVNTAGDPTYSGLQRARAQARQAIGLLTHVAADSLRPLIGHLYALQGYTEVLLAELYCSGVPLSTIDYGADYTLSPGVSTADVYQHALVLFDTALAMTGDSERITDLARVGRARTLLDLGEAAQAAQAVAPVPDGYRYALSFTATVTAAAFNFAQVRSDGYWGMTVADREGLNGLPYRSSGDPRTTATAYGRNQFGQILYHPDKYATDGSSPIVLGDFIEARLIAAEAALQAGDPTWLETLNALRTDGTYDTQPDPSDSTKTDTLWHAGTAGTDGLGVLADPGTPDERVDLVFHERAFWLFLTGHRQGDLRRLIRYYGRDPESVYPSGPYPGGGFYGGDVTMPIPPQERLNNPRFTGCLSRGA